MWYKWQTINMMSDSDIWRMVTYVSIWSCQEWKIKSYDNARQVAYVVYNCGNNWLMYNQYTAECTNYIDLEF